MKDVKSAIDELRKIKQTTSIPESSGTKKNYDEHDMFQSINMELRANKEKCKDLEVSLLTVNEAVKKLEEQLKNAKNGSGNNGSNSNNNAESVSDLKRSLAEDVNDRFSVLSQKLNNLAQ